MPPTRFRFTIGQIMAAVAVFALAMSAFGPRFAPAALAIPLVAAAAFVAARRRWGAPRGRVAAWILVAYPLIVLVALYLSRAVDCGMLGHRPGFAATDRTIQLGFPADDLAVFAALLLIGSLPAAWLCIGFVLAEVVRSTRVDATGPNPAPLIMSAVASWFFLFLFVRTDPGGSFAWFWD